ncbi:ABC transporter ATP-binding protein [Polycladidibacter stylochi]|uniref:ABC transporter ATP-binding protein n=1 Tax=Polycladidibacter stylochi TaxID=1807766 RepID=UPI00082EFA4E|nr:ABC transporter ATP-binding protein [Pseudovibrio stylochi]
MTLDTSIHLKEISKCYQLGKNEITIFDEVTLNIPTGDFLAIMGPSGSGKSTILNLIGGIDRISSGQITVGSLRIDQMSEAKLSQWRSTHIGFVFQFYNLLPMLTAAQNIELPLLLTSLSRYERAERVKTILDIVGLSKRGKHLPSELSGGQQQRVGIARAIAMDPQVLLCDEPTGDLDRQSAEEILDILKILNTEMGKTIVMVTHDPSATAYAKRTLHLDKGQFVRKELEAAQ